MAVNQITVNKAAVKSLVRLEKPGLANKRGKAKGPIHKNIHRKKLLEKYQSSASLGPKC